MACVCAHAVDTIAKQCCTSEVKEKGTAFAWIFLLHYIPMVYAGGWSLILKHVAAFTTVLFIYKRACIASYIGSNMNIDNAFMHCALVMNNLIAFNLVER